LLIHHSSEHSINQDILLFFLATPAFCMVIRNHYKLKVLDQDMDQQNKGRGISLSIGAWAYYGDFQQNNNWDEFLYSWMIYHANHSLTHHIHF
jgi:hypothetical protein